MILFLFACGFGTKDEACIGLCDTSDSASLYIDDSGQSDTDSDTPQDTADSSGCIPNHDAQIERHEYPVDIGIQADFLRSNNTAINLEGTIQNGTYYWDFSSLSGQEQLESIEPRPSSEYWFAADFPSETYVNVLSYENSIYGIFSLTDEALYLHGMASFESGWTETLLSYDPPVRLLQFPLHLNQSWSDESSISGTLDGVWTFYSELYSHQIDETGYLNTPLGEFPVLRINSQISRTIGLLEYSNRSVSFMSECAGAITTIQAELDEADVNFQMAQELLRIAP